MINEQTTVQDLITAIEQATEADSVSNIMVARVLRYATSIHAVIAQVRAAQSIGDLPAEPTSPPTAYIVEGRFYVYVGEGGDTLDGLYQDCGALEGPAGPQGPKGNDGVVLDGVTVFDELSSLDGKTTEQKHDYVPTGNAVKEIYNNIDDAEQVKYADGTIVAKTVVRTSSRYESSRSTGKNLADGYLVDVDTNPNTRGYTIAKLESVGISPGDIIIFNCWSTSTSAITFKFAFFSKDGNVESGDAYMDEGYYQVSTSSANSSKANPVKRYTKVPAGATHVAVAHYVYTEGGTYESGSYIDTTVSKELKPLTDEDAYTVEPYVIKAVEDAIILSSGAINSSGSIINGYCHTEKIRLYSDTVVKINPSTIDTYGLIRVSVYNSSSALQESGNTPDDYLTNESSSMLVSGSWFIEASYTNPKWIVISHQPTKSQYGSTITVSQLNSKVSISKYVKKEDNSTDFVPFDFAISDKNGYNIVEFGDGHIKTQKFNSAEISSPYKPYQHETKISYSVNGNMPCEPYVEGRTSFTSVSKSISVTPNVIYSDRAALYLPKSYTVGGTPTRLVITGRQGGGVFTNSNNFVKSDIDSPNSSNFLNIFPCLLHLGYAVLAIDGTPDDWASDMMNPATIGSGSDPFEGYVNGNYIAVRSARYAYDKVIREYNICKDGVFGFGYSQGGWMILNIAELSGIPFLGVIMKSPVVSLSTYFQAFKSGVIEAYKRSGQTEYSATWLSSDAEGQNVITPQSGKIYLVRDASTGSYQNMSEKYAWNSSNQSYEATTDAVYAGGSVKSPGDISYPRWRYFMIRQYYGINPAATEMSIDDFMAIPEQPWRWAGYDPFCRYSDNPATSSEIFNNDIDTITMSRSCHFPAKIWIGDADGTVGYKRQSVLVKAIRNMGGSADIRIYSNGDHYMGPTWWTSLGTFTYSGNNKTYNIYPPVYEMMVFLSEHGGNEVTLNIE